MTVHLCPSQECAASQHRGVIATTRILNTAAPTELRQRTAAVHQQAAQHQTWYRVENKARVADVYLFDEIGFWGVTAGQFVDEIAALDVKTINLHLNSPGGEVWDGIAIYNALKDHPAHVVGIVDGVAASSASFILMAADERVMNRKSELMIHDAWGMAVGNASDMADLASRLNAMSDNIASIYADRTGTTTTEWRDAMRAETWYSDEEAVEAGLADRVADKGDAENAKARINFSIFNYAGRAKAPPPAYPKEARVADQPAATVVDTPAAPTPPSEATVVTHTAPAADPPAPTDPPADPPADSTEAPAAVNSNKEGVGMQIDPAQLREALGLTPHATDDEVRMAIIASGFASITPFDEGGPQPARVGRQQTINAGAVLANGVVAVDQSILDQLRQDAAAGQEAWQRLTRQERDHSIAAAINDGKFAPARREHWENAWDRDPEGTKQAIDSLTKGLIPTSPQGYSVDPEGKSAEDELYGELFGKEVTR